jgi:eukaryotic-like serine/threonine-protein kinase
MIDTGRLTAALAGRYAIARELGAGGMATVYLARDLKHDRDVALKVLRPELAAVLGAERFLQEIRISARLDHPHILTLIDSGESDGFVWYVLPYVRGESLRAKLTREQQLSIEETQRIATQVASALDYAHRQGVIHRDIKPENILLHEGEAVVADFGIALAVREAGGTRLTESGFSLGTPQYMSPEQATGGRELDARSDVYSLAAVVYEMLAGEPPHTGPTVQAVIAKLLTERPTRIRTVRETVPESIDTAVAKALAKVPADRFAGAAEFAAALVTTTRPIAAVSIRGQLMRVGFVAAGTLLLGLVAWVALRPPQPPRLVIGQTAPITNDPGLEIDPALSPDGSFIAYAAGPQFATRIYVRQAEGGRPILVGDSARPGQRWPRWSPDGRRILYVATGSVLVAPALGGRSQQVIQHRDLVMGADWSPDGRQIAYASGDSLYLAAADGGLARALAAVPEAHSPAWSPDGGRIAVVSGNTWYVGARLYGNLALSTIVVVRTRDGAAIPVTDGRALHASPVWSPGGRWLLFVSNQNGPRDVYVVGVTATGYPHGSTERLTTGLQPHSITLGARGRRLAYNIYNATANIWSLPIPTGGPVSAGAARSLTRGNQVIEDFSVSPDGKWIVYDSDRSGRGEVYKVSTDGGEPTQLTDATGGNYVPALSPDGQEVAFQSQRNGNRDLFLMPAQGGPAQPLVVEPGQDNTPGWSPDGRRILFEHYGGGLPDGVYVIERSSGGGWSAPRRIAATVGGTHGLAWTPDGRAVLMSVGGFGDSLELVSLDSGAPRVLWVRRNETEPNASYPVYSLDRTRIYFLGLVGEPNVRAGIWVLPASGGQPREIVRFDDPDRIPLRGNWGTDGKRFFFTTDDRQSDVWAGDVSGLP